MLSIALVALIAIRRELLEPGANIILRGIVPFGIRLQAKIDAHLRILLLAYWLLALRGLKLVRALLFISGNGCGESHFGVQFIIERLNISGAEEALATNTLAGFDTPILHPLLKHHTIYAQPARRLARI